jgi:hypothetical protein
MEPIAPGSPRARHRRERAEPRACPLFLSVDPSIDIDVEDDEARSQSAGKCPRLAALSRHRTYHCWVRPG